MLTTNEEFGGLNLSPIPEIENEYNSSPSEVEQLRKENEKLRAKLKKRKRLLKELEKRSKKNSKGKAGKTIKKAIKRSLPAIIKDTAKQVISFVLDGICSLFKRKKVAA